MTIICRISLSLLLSIGSGTSISTVWADQDPLADARKAEIETILLHDCGSCHGITLQGGLGPAITAESVKLKPDSYLFNTIRNGLDGTPMPPWLGILTEAEIRYLVSLLKQEQTDS